MAEQSKKSGKAASKVSNKRASRKSTSKVSNKSTSTAAARPTTGSSVAANKVTTKKDGAVKAPFDRKRLLTAVMWLLVVVFSFTLVDLLVQYLNNDYSAAVVNGTRVPQSEFNQRIEELYGAAVIEQMITEELVQQKGREEGVEVTEEEIQEVIDETKEQLGGDEKFKEALESNNLTEERYRVDVRLRLIAQEIVVEAPTDEQLADFFESYKSIYFEEEDQFENVKDDVSKLYYNQKFREESESWIATLREEAQIQNNIDDKPEYGLLTTTRNILDNILNR